ncbi:MAG TPA: tRNA (N6-isopentenyl adenosine(37)-C2)-methylthiotransferase MiaB [Rectinema sp.]|jgi:tRNA-2-methylthio-N6-dimethylallyladenosine synthase|nr:tRNA (N6-isopentenyl adenosine(37)-C2)-methylthiotransferase MiaB [Spirochaetia bacterium]HAL93153.1 tRNA (N6-isopentenyl adenosine(37)-C2)-methylthiotransferase MiaB [Spirochaetaceae bacterium]HNV18923.1 tRNA (N6-isopentenyl adenosine(37)-C2)-methylthiotransferase MiaB [Rectinema sp.]HNY98786.1 tRNA (N6-isopentenyl adenosine(37)-C2)-methylthiotransferase MiaB [Rectinema sp.]HOD58315.1 tRNA (N6-isopentenyl adenosine(37)-C2)-methylthiotransferase MiaB [Rectinema sp.]
MKNYHIETYGCEMNKAESAAMEMTLKEHGWEQSREQEAQLILLNTCTVRATAENRVWNRIHQLTARKKEHNFVLAVVGCMAEQYKNDIREKAPGVDYVLGTFQKQSFSLMLDTIANGHKIEVLEESPSYVFGEFHHEGGAFRSFIPIMHGCNNFCTYCIVPYVRGREISRNPMDILREIDKLEDLGVREITLLGQNVNSYSWEKDGTFLDFPGLLKMIGMHLRKKQESKDTMGRYDVPFKQSERGIGWIRFLTSHPKDFSKELIAVMAEDPFFCHHLHLPLQSGSNTILSAMNRKYTREYYLSVIDIAKKAIPDLTFSTDIMVGFPGETEEDLEQTLSLMQSVHFSYAFMYHFNEREGTFAAGLPNKVPEKVKKARLAQVIALQKEITASLMRERIGQVDEVLIENRSKQSLKELLARTSRDEMVVFPGSPTRIGQFAQVRFISVAGNTLRGEEV